MGHFLTSLLPDIGMFAGVARGRWRVVAMHSILDALGEDASWTIERTAGENLAVALVDVFHPPPCGHRLPGLHALEGWLPEP